MPSIISSPKFSLVKFDEKDSYLLPAFNKFDSAFQFIVNAEKPIAETLRLWVINMAGALVPNVFPSNVLAVPISYILDLTEANYDAWTNFYLKSITVNGIITEYNYQVTKDEFKTILFEEYGYKAISNNRFEDNGTGNIFTVSFQQFDNPAPGGGSYEVVNHDTVKLWWRGYVAAPGTLIAGKLSIGSCFRYCLLDQSDNVVAFTNVFKVRNSNNDLSLITYSNNENAFDFFYNNGYVIYDNVQLVPVLLHSPQNPVKRSAYQYSNGRHKLLSATVEKQYQLQVDFMPASFHEAFTILLIHDNIKIDCINIDDTPVEVISSGDYQVEWDEDTKQNTAQAASVVTVATFGYKNDNCE